MHLDAFRDHALALPGATEDLPFGPDTLVFRVGGKIFALLALDAATVNLKCDPEAAVELRERYADVQPGYHMNKQHWNTVALQGDVPASEIRAMTAAAYGLVRAGLTRAAQAALPEWSL